MRPTLSEAFRRAIIKGRGQSPEGLAVTMARVVKIFSNGHVEVLAGTGARTLFAIVPVAGEGLRTIRPGQMVAVGWQRNRPVVAIAHSARRSGAPVPLPQPTGVILEELFIATRPEDGVVDVYFRDATQTVPLQLDTLVGTAGFREVRWGPSNKHFLVRDTSTPPTFWIFELDRDEFTPFEEGVDPAGAVSLLRTHALAETTGPVLATVAATNQPGGPIVLRPTHSNGEIVQSDPPLVIRAGPGIVDSALDTIGDLILSYAIGITGLGRTAVLATTTICGIPNPGPNLHEVRGEASFNFSYPVIVNVTQGTVLLDGYTAGVGSEVAPLPGSSVVFDTLDLRNLPGTGSKIDEVLGVGDCAGQVVGELWCFKYALGPTQHRVAPILVQGAQPDLGLGNVVNGLMAYLVRLGEGPPESLITVGLDFEGET